MKTLLSQFTRKPRLSGQAGGESVNAPTNESSSATPRVESTVYPVGCETLSEGTDPIVADVVFVHGLRGHRIDTWSEGTMCWPRDLLQKEKTMSHVRILTFGYDANVANALGRASMNTLFEHSIDLLTELTRERKGDARDRPIIFVTHSLGGLIAKDALDQSERIQDQADKVQDQAARAREPKFRLAHVFNSTRGIIFLGTPHRGSGQTTLAKLVAFVAKVSLKSTNSSLIRDLERDSQTLDRIRDSFSRILDRRTLTVYSFSEELAMPAVGIVVHKDSAILNDAYEIRDTIHADHVGMCKFTSPKDSGYKKVLDAIEVLLEGISATSSSDKK